MRITATRLIYKLQYTAKHSLRDNKTSEGYQREALDNRVQLLYCGCRVGGEHCEELSLTTSQCSAHFKSVTWAHYELLVRAPSFVTKCSTFRHLSDICRRPLNRCCCKAVIFVRPLVNIREKNLEIRKQWVETSSRLRCELSRVTNKDNVGRRNMTSNKTPTISPGRGWVFTPSPQLCSDTNRFALLQAGLLTV